MFSIKFHYLVVNPWMSKHLNNFFCGVVTTSTWKKAEVVKGTTVSSPMHMYFCVYTPRLLIYWKLRISPYTQLNCACALVKCYYNDDDLGQRDSLPCDWLSASNPALTLRWTPKHLLSLKRIWPQHQINGDKGLSAHTWTSHRPCINSHLDYIL